jgi:O-antigen/teichoic acid export membrane protein
MQMGIPSAQYTTASRWQSVCNRYEMLWDARWSLGSNATLAATGAITGVLAARLLGSEGRGQLAVVMLWPMLLCNLVSIGLSDAFGCYSGWNPVRAGALSKLALWCAAGQGVAASVLAAILFPLFLRNQGPEVVRLSAVYSCAAPVYMASNYLINIVHASGRLRIWNALRMVPQLTYFLGLGLLALTGRRSVADVVAVLALGHALSAVGTLTVLLRSTDWSQPTAWDLTRPIFRYGTRNLLAGVAWTVNSRLDQMLMTWFLSPQQIGSYVAATGFAGILVATAQAFASLMLPRITRCAQLIDAGVVIRSALRAALAVLVPAAGLLSLAAPWLMVRLYGRDFAGGALAAQILVVGAVALGLNQVMYEALRALNQPFGVAVGELSGTIVSFLALWALLPRLGITGAALASAASYSTVYAALTCYAKRLLAASGEHPGMPLGTSADVTGSPPPLSAARRIDALHAELSPVAAGLTASEPGPGSK